MARATVLRVVCVIGLAVSSSVLILLVPSLFDAGGQVSPWALGVPAFLAVIFAVGGLRLRPAASR